MNLRRNELRSIVRSPDLRRDTLISDLKLPAAERKLVDVNQTLYGASPYANQWPSDRVQCFEGAGPTATRPNQAFMCKKFRFHTRIVTNRTGTSDSLNRGGLQSPVLRFLKHLTMEDDGSRLMRLFKEDCFKLGTVDDEDRWNMRPRACYVTRAVLQAT